MSVAIEFTADDEKRLLENKANVYLTKSPEEKYAEFKDHDPFPSIVPDALLNSFDIVRYVYTTGMIYPFRPKGLEGAVYKCNFSGYYKYWDENHELREGTLDDSGELKLRPNSISFLGIEPVFRIPTYFVLRFNLKVQHVYKGLLLGTGPIVDPGFVGQLYIPLHNLTSNDYTIKKNAPLISVEFTKLSKHEYRDLTEDQEHIVNNLDFRDVPVIANSIESLRDLGFYLYKALTDPMFKKTRTDELSVGSSIPEAIKKAEENAWIAGENAKKAEEEARKAVKSANKTKKFFNRFGWVALIVSVVTIGALVINIFSLIDGVNARIDNISSKYYELMQENKKIQEDNKGLEEMIDNLQSSINSLTQTDKDKNTVSK